jgi:type IX secretion system PorP/SprF family membrane protein
MKKILVTIVLLATCLSTRPQDLNFSQFYEQPLLRNPALGGIFDCNFRVKSVFRNQWQSVTVPYRTGGLSAEMKFPGIGQSWHNVGLQFMYDVAGDSKLQRTMVLPGYSFHLPLTEGNYLSMGVMGGFVSTQFDPTKLTWDDQFVNGQYSPVNPTRQLIRNSNRVYPELAMGMVFSRPVGELGDLYIGASMYHINRPVVSFDNDQDIRLDRKYGINAGFTVPSGGRNAVTFYGDGFVQGGHRQVMFGAFYTLSLADEYYDDKNKTSIHFGGVYRWDDAIIPVVKLDISQFSVGLSYDANVSKLKTASQGRGGFELTLSYRNCSIGTDRNGLPCPKFGSNF